LLFIKATQRRSGIMSRLIKKKSMTILSLADKGRERAQGQGGLRAESMFETVAQKRAMLKTPPKRTAFTVREILKLLFEIKRDVAPITPRAST
jgi:hypothetical protein